MKILTFITLVLCSLYPSFSQESEQEEKEEWKRFRIAIASTNSHVPAGETTRDRQIIPGWGLEFEYKLAERWMVALVNEIELQSYLVNNENVEELDREYPYKLFGIIKYELGGTYVGIGGGAEVEKNEDFGFMTYLIGYNWKFPNHWDFGPSFSYENRLDGFDTWTLNLVFGKSF